MKIKIIAYGYYINLCGFEKMELEVPVDYSAAYEYILSWLNKNFGCNRKDVWLLYYGNNAAKGDFQKTVQSGDEFKILPSISGG